jgi:hypothetical protein
MTPNQDMETSNYRYTRRTMWQVLRSRYAAEVADRIDAGDVEAAARLQAAKAIRGDLRMFMSELLTHAPVPTLLTFLGAARDWGEYGERVLEQGDAVLALIDTMGPRPPWAAPAPLAPDAAADDIRWETWVHTWLIAFRATGPAAEAAMPPGEPQAVKPTATKNSAARWLPWAVSAAAVLGATALVAITNRD